MEHEANFKECGIITREFQNVTQIYCLAFGIYILIFANILILISHLAYMHKNSSNLTYLWFLFTFRYLYQFVVPEMK